MGDRPLPEDTRLPELPASSIVRSLAGKMPFLKIVRKSHGVVVFLILGRIEQRHTRRLPKEFEERLEDLGSVIEFRRVATAELFPPIGVMPEPAAELRARSELPKPVVDGSRFLAKPPGPEPIDEDAHAVSRLGLVINPSNVDLHLTRLRMPQPRLRRGTIP